MHNKHIIDHTDNNDQVSKDTLLKGKNMEKCKNCDNKVYNNHRHCKDCLDKRTKQTSGKWVVRQEGTDHIYWRVYNSNGQVIINTAFDKVIAEQIVRDHNTLPDLLEALEEVYHIVNDRYELQPFHIRRMKEAIAKASEAPSSTNVGKDK